MSTIVTSGWPQRVSSHMGAAEVRTTHVASQVGADAGNGVLDGDIPLPKSGF